MSTDPTPAPRRRATDAERHATVEALGRALTAAQISPTEFEERSGTAWAAIYRDELPALLADLTPDPHAVLDRSPEQHDVTRTQVVPATDGSRLSVAIMGGAELTGDWQCAPTHTSINIMGGSEFDFTDARLAAQRTVLTTIDVMGGAEVKVPEDFRVVLEGFALMGGTGLKDAPGVTVKMSELPADAPTIVIRSFALMGGTDVLRVPRK
ncbi:DUF1707 SHOCT-like domain-containing protein [Corynebacterium guangdongense]|uniref:DUF1707 domain-containing protein n=1 Tax=Corynebacterium guangdongense TaxID=1783348 RepID=A0ABU1ZU83_9CORY|nr:DUF1707 domain-containing protein [Corynebacterium guangdongense]MDR7328489.1 hypothetical protein [Corynebacterium guangdongense]WJZ17066.1 hypothetical protein CGUA_02350 [Corynebacterium guangdongense]